MLADPAIRPGPLVLIDATRLAGEPTDDDIAHFITLVVRLSWKRPRRVAIVTADAGPGISASTVAATVLSSAVEARSFSSADDALAWLGEVVAGTV